MATTSHYTNDRVAREKLIESLGGYGKVILSVEWDKGHPDGPEIHKVTDNGIVIIYNAWTGRKVTTLIARPGQISRYYTMRGLIAPENLLLMAKERQEKGFNLV